MKKSLQIIIMGWEWDRLIYGLRNNPPKKAILICPLATKGPRGKFSGTTMNITKKLINEIKSLIDVEIVYVDFYDFDDCTTKFIEILEKNKNKFDDININISTGTKIVLSSAITVSQYYNVNIFYVVPGRYNVPDETPYASSGAVGMIEIPTMKLNDIIILKGKEKELFMNIPESGTTFSNLVKMYAKENDIRLDKIGLANLKSISFYHIKKMERKSILKTEMRDGLLFMNLTNTGRFLRKIMLSKKN